VSACLSDTGKLGCLIVYPNIWFWNSMVLELHSSDGQISNQISL